MKGTIVGSYRILDTISVGGMGTVYRAEHTLIGRLAAVKILHPELCANRNIVSRFFNEARATTSIKHPGIVEVFDFGYMPSGHAYLIMEFLEGMPLSHRVRARGPIPEGEAALLLRSVCIALAAAHDKGIVHRDLKPDNIFVMVDPDSVLGERTKILDFGIAKLTDIGANGSTTKTGAVMGTPTYMSPEQCRGTGDVDHRADLYSIGCMFYELVAGRPPFVNAGAGEAIGSHLFVQPQPPSRHVSGLSADTEALIMKLLAKVPERRVQSAKELAQLLAVIAQQHGWAAIGEISRPPLGNTPTAPPALDAPSYTPASATTPTTLQPTTVTPGGVVHVMPSAPSLASVPSLRTHKPTTLSGAASEIRDPRRSRVRLVIAGGLLAVAGGIAAGAVLAGSSHGPATSATGTIRSAAPPAGDPAPVPPAITVAPSPPPPTIAPTAPAIAPIEDEPTPAGTSPTSTTGPTTPGQTTEPAATTGETATTAAAPPSKPKKATPSAAGKPSATTRPAAKPPKRPATKVDKGSASEDKDKDKDKDKDLLEQDI